MIREACASPSQMDLTNVTPKARSIFTDTHAKRIGDELIVDIDHYRKHPGCDMLWCVVYDPEHLIRNPERLKDLEGPRTSKDGTVEVKLLVL